MVTLSGADATKVFLNKIYQQQKKDPKDHENKRFQL